jgi:hypothetical protein
MKISNGAILTIIGVITTILSIVIFINEISKVKKITVVKDGVQKEETQVTGNIVPSLPGLFIPSFGLVLYGLIYGLSETKYQIYDVIGYHITFGILLFFNIIFTIITFVSK